LVFLFLFFLFFFFREANDFIDKSLVQNWFSKKWSRSQGHYEIWRAKKGMDYITSN